MVNDDGGCGGCEGGTVISRLMGDWGDDEFDDGESSEDDDEIDLEDDDEELEEEEDDDVVDCWDIGARRV